MPEKILEEWEANKLEAIVEVRKYQQAKTIRNNNTIPFRRREGNDNKSVIEQLREELK